MSSSASSCVSTWSFSSVSWIDGALSKTLRISSRVQPSAFRSTVMSWRRLRSMRTPTVSFLSTSNSSQAPRPGMIFAMKTYLSSPCRAHGVAVAADSPGSGAVIARAQTMLDLIADPAQIEGAIVACIRPHVAGPRLSGLRLPGSSDGFETHSARRSSGTWAESGVRQMRAASAWADRSLSGAARADAGVSGPAVAGERTASTLRPLSARRDGCRRLARALAGGTDPIRRQWRQPVAAALVAEGGNSNGQRPNG